jgi:hypothetical protein
MVPLMHRDHVLQLHPDVNLRGPHGRMPENRLDVPNVRSTPEKMRGAGVSKQMRSPPRVDNSVRLDFSDLMG